ncbi:MAG: GIY-YIG nuclease family protein [Erysipelotrichaceae bacterium]|nr:GIY-YIG nuclease family protein [Erysipelotrichaceae bacterium]
MIRGKTLKLFLMDGDSTGRIKCTLANWTGIVYKIPRIALDKCKNIEYLKQSGIYFLFGTDEKYDQIVYVGQARVRKNGKGLLYRVQEPHSSIDWTEAVMVTTTNNSFGPTEISYLENRFCNLAIDAGRYQVKNGNEPSLGNITEETESELEEFIDCAKIVIGTLGHKVFEPLMPQSSDIDDEPILYMKYKNSCASGKRTNEGFIIFKGSVITSTTTKSCPENILKLRKKHINKINDKNELISDLLMTSPSTAAGFIGGASLNGFTVWHDDQGKSLKQLEEQNQE